LSEHVGVQIINTRCSTRRFRDLAVPAELLEEIIIAGLRAPSSKNSSPWYIAVATGEFKEKICAWVEENRDGLPTAPGELLIDEPLASPRDSTTATLRYVRSAPVLLLIFNRAPFSGGRAGIIDRAKSGELAAFENEYVSLGACMENILLAAHALGLGAIALMDILPAAPRVREETGIPYDLVLGVLVGYPVPHDRPLRHVDFERLVTYLD